jgi:aminoglycoside phosphotransferase (APT) family kinase protein
VIDLDVLCREVRRVAGLDDDPQLRFLARGEYSLNYLGDIDSRKVVIRCVTGSQIGLSLSEQVLYESRALRALEGSGRTPACLAVQPEPAGIPFPFLIETYLPGRPLDYGIDLTAAAQCVAAIHDMPVSPGHGLQVHADPFTSISGESRQWAGPYLAWSGASRESRSALARAFAIVEDDQTRAARVFTEPDLAFVNYDLNTHNFIVAPDGGFVSLVDWEKARVAPAVQDIAHFLIPTTTLWRASSATRLTDEQESRFTATYLAARQRVDPQAFAAQLAMMRRLIALRAVSWCSWAVQSADAGQRVITNDETIERSRSYLEPAFLEELFIPGSG